MSTTTTNTQHHYTPIALAAAATAVVVGGLTAIGVAASHDSTSPAQPSTSTSSTYHGKCNADPRCFPPSKSHYVSKGQGDPLPPPVRGGRTMPGLP
jgi:hypothetical protein